MRSVKSFEEFGEHVVILFERAVCFDKLARIGGQLPHRPVESSVRKHALINARKIVGGNCCYSRGLYQICSLFRSCQPLAHFADTQHRKVGDGWRLACKRKRNILNHLQVYPGDPFWPSKVNHNTCERVLQEGQLRQQVGANLICTELALPCPLNCGRNDDKAAGNYRQPSPYKRLVVFYPLKHHNIGAPVAKGADPACTYRHSAASNSGHPRPQVKPQPKQWHADQQYRHPLLQFLEIHGIPHV